MLRASPASGEGHHDARRSQCVATPTVPGILAALRACQPQGATNRACRLGAHTYGGRLGAMSGGVRPRAGGPGLGNTAIALLCRSTPNVNSRSTPNVLEISHRQRGVNFQVALRS